VEKLARNIWQIITLLLEIGGEDEEDDEKEIAYLDWPEAAGEIAKETF
jgi:hypothetical protein